MCVACCLMAVGIEVCFRAHWGSCSEGKGSTSFALTVRIFGIDYDWLLWRCIICSQDQARHDKRLVRQCIHKAYVGGGYD